MCSLVRTSARSSAKDWRRSHTGGADADHLNKLAAVRECKGCDLSGAALSFGSFKNADLSGADLSGAKLKGANLYRVNLLGARLTDADLSEVTNLGKITIGEAVLCRTLLPSGIENRDCK